MTEIESSQSSISDQSRIIRWCEISLIFAICFAFAASPPPEINEAHYLSKAKNYWVSDFCGEDIFLDSSDAHLAFYWVFGWITAIVPFSTAAWIGRITIWCATAFAWQRFSFRVIEKPFVSVATFGMLLLGVDNLHMAGEWLIGGIEAKGFAFVFLFLALGDLVQCQWNRVWIFLGCAASFHVLVGGWGVVAAGVAWTLFDEHHGGYRTNFLRMLPGLFLGGAISLLGLVPAVFLTRGENPLIVDQANQIYVLERISHHLVFSSFKPTWMVVRHGLLAAFWIATMWTTWRTPKLRRVHAFVIGTAMIALIGIAIDQFVLAGMNDKATASRLLRFYWFRMSDVMIPCGATFGLLGGFMLAKKVHQSVGWGITLLCFGLIGWQLYGKVNERLLDSRPRADQQLIRSKDFSIEMRERIHSEWEKVCEWVKEETPMDSRFMTPRQFQTFKWYAERSEVVNWKDVPQDAAGIVEWSKRFKTLHKKNSDLGIFQHSNERLNALIEKYDADFIIVTTPEALRREAMRKQIGPNQFEAVPFPFIKVYPSDNSESLFRIYKVD